MFWLPVPAIFAATFAMSQGARNWPFFTLIALAGLARGEQQVGLAAQEGRDLQHIDRLGGRRALLRRMHIGQHRQAGRSRTSASIAEPLAMPMPRAAAALVRLALSKLVL